MQEFELTFWSVLFGVVVGYIFGVLTVTFRNDDNDDSDNGGAPSST